MPGRLVGLQEGSHGGQVGGADDARLGFEAGPVELEHGHRDARLGFGRRGAGLGVQRAVDHRGGGGGAGGAGAGRGRAGERDAEGQGGGGHRAGRGQRPGADAGRGRGEGFRCRAEFSAESHLPFAFSVMCSGFIALSLFRFARPAPQGNNPCPGGGVGPVFSARAMRPGPFTGQARSFKRESAGLSAGKGRAFQPGKDRPFSWERTGLSAGKGRPFSRERQAFQPAAAGAVPCPGGRMARVIRRGPDPVRWCPHHTGSSHGPLCRPGRCRPRLPGPMLYPLRSGTGSQPVAGR